MRMLLKGGNVYDGQEMKVRDIIFTEEGIVSVGKKATLKDFNETVNCMGLIVTPGLCDVHVHFREPGFEYKETVETGSRAAAAGGYTDVCTMPNLNPPPVNMEGLQPQLKAIRANALVSVWPMGRITNSGKLADMEEIADFVAGFSDDGEGVMDEDMMKRAMEKAKTLNKLIVAHAEDTSYAPEDSKNEYLPTQIGRASCRERV